MQYRSTRGSIDDTLNAPQAIIKGLADDGGLLVPVKFPSSSLPIEKLPKMTYQQIVQLILNLFLPLNSYKRVSSRLMVNNGTISKLPLFLTIIQIITI